MDHATASSLLGIPGVVWFWLLSAVGIGGVVFSLNRRYGLLTSGRPDNRFDRLDSGCMKHMVDRTIEIQTSAKMKSTSFQADRPHQSIGEKTNHS